MEFDDWFNLDENRDLRMPMYCKLSFVKRLSNKEWIELLQFIYEKSKGVEDGK